MHRPDAVFAIEACRLKTRVATIDIRGTEYDGRLCETDCAEKIRRPRVYAGGIRICQEDAETQACHRGTRIDIPTGKGGYSDGETKGLTRDENSMRGRDCAR